MEEWNVIPSIVVKTVLLARMFVMDNQLNVSILNGNYLGLVVVNIHLRITQEQLLKETQLLVMILIKRNSVLQRAVKIQ